MERFIEDYLRRWQDLQSAVLGEIGGLSSQALDWSPGPDIPTLAVLVVHLIGAGRFWIGDVALGEPTGRVRTAEFEVRGLQAHELGERLDSFMAYARQTCARLGAEELDAQRLSPLDGESYSVSWCLVRALTHAYEHLGHIQLIHQLWTQRVG